MAFKLGDLIIDRIVEGVAEVISGADAGKLLYRLTNLQEATIEVTADSVDAVDGQGTLIKTFYRGKQGTFTATNSTISLPVIDAMSGTDAEIASAANAITMPRIITASRASGTDAVEVALPGITDTSLTNHNVIVHHVELSGTLGDQIPAASLSLAGATSGTASILSITDTNANHKAWIIKYDRNVTANGIKIVNRSDAFPKTVKLTLKVLIVDPCEPDTVRAAYVVLPSFQPSAEVSIQFSTDATIDYTGKLQTSYCGTEKVLYEIYVCSDDEEEAA